MIATGTKVRVYWNLHKDCYSIQTKTDKDWKVTLHADQVRLQDVQFIVQPGNRDRVRAEQRKNVHAFMVGTWVPDQLGFGIPVRYNPYLHDTFVADGEAIHAAEYVYGFTTPDKHPRLTAIVWE